ncbi:hypothetical protein AB1Y20_004674 [Prymnesium parvum]|uniref:Prolyl endopeptidase n=1 Tax=Prymnesium parvum TaxID=97485 RepID=A0AB34IXG8_PRYPA
MIARARALLLVHSALRPVMTSRTTPPVAKRVPHMVKFGRVEGENRGPQPMDTIEVMDDLFWLRDDTRQNEEVLQHLREENAYTQGRTAHLVAFRTALYDEMLGHVKEDDDTFPHPRADGYKYWSRTIKGASFRQYLRRPRGGEAEELLLDVNVAATEPFFSSNAGWSAAQCDVQEVKPSPSGALLAYSIDGSGYETYAIRLKDLRTGEEWEETLRETDGSIAWTSDETLFYVKMDSAHRPFQVWRHALGTSQEADVLVYEDADELFNVGCGTSRDGSLLLIESESKETSEVRFVPTAAPTATPTVVRPRQFGVRYDVDSHAPSRSLFLTSNADGKVNRQLLVASLDSPADWQPVAAEGAPVLAHSETRSLDGVSAFSDFLVVSGREDGFTQLWVVSLAAATHPPQALAAAYRLSFDAESFTAHESGNLLFDPAGKLRLEYTSMVSPKALLEFDLAARTFRTLKVQPVPAYDAALYETARIEVGARDGTAIPVTLLWRRDAASTAGDAPAPLHLYGYGSYGVCIDPSFSSTRLALVDRGVVFAIAHVRGGGEMGHHAWYEKAGKYLTKRNTFHDFVDCAHALLERKIARAGALTCEGRSAGGLLVGNVVNLAPQLFKAAVAGVPFVDLMVTMCDPSIPLTTEEWEEWGNPNEERYHDYMMSYSPINNVQEGVDYPAMLIVSGLNDPRVAFWEPTKWAQVLRSKVNNGEDILLKMDLDAGHFSAADRYRYLRELAFDYAWLLDQYGMVDTSQNKSS